MQKTNKYGFFTTFSIIFAGVVGVGIFFKGQTIMSLTESGLLMVLAWILVSLIALGLAFSYIEISSSTIKGEKAEQGSLFNWGSKFYNERFGSFIGVFFCFFYMPLNMIALALISSRMLINLFVGADYGILDIASSSSTWATSNKEAQIFYGILIFIIAAVFILFFIGFNAFGTKGSKIVQSSGMVLKIGLLLTIIGIIIYGLASGINDTTSLTPTTPTYDDTFVGEPNAGGFFLALPAIMFCLDGFVMAGTLQSDTKESKTFQKALLTSCLTIIILYLFIILGTSLIHNATGYDVPGIVNTIFGDFPVFQLLILAFITVSGIICTNSFLIYLGRTISDLADHNEIINKNDDLNYKHPQTGAYTYAYRLVLTIVLIYLVSFFILDMSLFPYATGTVDIRNVFGNVEISSTDLIVMMMFFIYALILVGGLMNRKSNKIDVDKLKGFPVIASIISGLIFFVVGSYIISVPLGYFGIGSELKMDNNNFGSFWALPIDIVLIGLIFLVWHLLHVYRKREIKSGHIKDEFSKNLDQKEFTQDLSSDHDIITKLILNNDKISITKTSEEIFNTYKICQLLN